MLSILRGQLVIADMHELQTRCDADQKLADLCESLIALVTETTAITDVDDLTDDMRETLEESVRESVIDNMDVDDVPTRLRESIEESERQSVYENYECQNCGDEYARGLEEGKSENETRALVPETGSFHGFKKLAHGAIAEVRIPANSERICGADGDKCRARYVETVAIWNADGIAINTGVGSRSATDPTRYTVGTETHADAWDGSPDVQCTHGIHFFLTRAGAENY